MNKYITADGKLRLQVTYMGFRKRETETWVEDRWSRNLRKDDKGNIWIELQGHMVGSQVVCAFNLGKNPREPVDLDKLEKSVGMF